MIKENIVGDFEYDWCNLSEERELENSKIKIEIGKPVNMEAFEKESEEEILEAEEEEKG